MTVPFDYKGQPLYLIHRENELIPDIVEGGYAIINKKDLSAEFFPDSTILAAHLVATLDDSDLKLCLERRNNVLDLYLVYSVSLAKYAETLIDQSGRTQDVYERRMRVQKYFTENRERLGLTTEFLAKTHEAPDQEEQALHLAVIDEEEDDQ